MLNEPKVTPKMNAILDEFKDSKDERLNIFFSKKDGTRYEENIDVQMKYIKFHRWDVIARACRVLEGKLGFHERLEPVVDFGIIFEDSERGIEISSFNKIFKRWKVNG